MGGGALWRTPEEERESGQALVEYALILALIAVVAVGSLTLVGTSVAAILDFLQGSINGIPLP